jgi:hypothetical protein
MPTLFAVTVDTEEEWDWSAGFPCGTPSVSNVELLPRFQEICSRRGAAVTYFTNHAVLAAAAARRTLLEVARKEHVEIGMHIHPWNTPPLQNGAVTAPRESFIRNLPDELARQKLETVYSTFVEHGLRPTSFRGGRYSSGGSIHRFLVEKSFLADASVVPYTGWTDDGAPDYRHRDLQPVRLQPVFGSGAALWEIPLTLGFTRTPFGLWRKFYETVETTPLRHLRLIGIAERLHLVRRVWLSFEDPMGRDMLPWLDRLQQFGLPCICFTLHSSSLKVGANGCYSRDEADQRRLFEQVDEVLAVLASRPDFQPATISEIAQHLESQHHAHSRN